MRYTLMNRNIKILDFEYQQEYQAFLGVSKVYDLTYAPLSLQYCHSKELAHSFYQWFNDRKIPPMRDELQYLLKSLKYTNTTELMMRHYGLSLSDQYWFLPENEDILWEDINFFDNSYSSHNFLEATFRYSDFQLSSDYNISPNASTNGQLSKCWIQKNRKNILFKGANTIYRFEAICEVIASRMCEVLKVPYVEYQCLALSGTKSRTLVSACPVMIQSHQEFIPAYHILQVRKKQITHTSADYELYLDILNEHHVPHAREYVEKMNMLDFILANEDRHLGNFGVIRNLNTLKWESVCPIFDTGRSLNTNVSRKYWLEEKTDMKFFTHDFVSSENVCRTFSIRISHQQINKMYELTGLFQELLETYLEELPIHKDDIYMLKKSFEKRIELFESIMYHKHLIIDD